MTESALLAFAAGLGLGALGVLLTVLAWRIVRANRALGTPAEHATFSTLHLASRAAAQLRGGLGSGDPARAARTLRTLLDCDALALADDHGVVALEGSAAGLEASAERCAAAVRGSGRAQVFSDATTASTEGGAMDAVAAPIRIRDGSGGSGRAAGALVAYTTPPARPSLVRATEEVAEWIAAQLDLAELDASRAALAEAEVRALRAQISPHFIYNALTAIASTITTDPARARQLVLDFADFTRYSFRRQGDFASLADELQSIDSYLQLERARFGERLTVTLQIAPEVLATMIPFLSVQPLVENAVRHGIEPEEGGGSITIRAHDAGAFAEIQVEDDGVGIDPEQLRAAFAGRATVEHIGLRNVDSRLRQLYGEECGLLVDTNLGAGTLVTMRIPKSQPHHVRDGAST